jgi:NOL1/NOP2/fmu family ribosome biogenesis protein
MPSLAAVSLAAGNPMQAVIDRFGIEPAALAKYQCWATGKRRLWLLDAETINFASQSPETFGIPLATYTNLGLKPSTAFLQRFGPLIQQNVVQLPDQPAAQLFVAGRSQPLAAKVEPGFVHVRYQDFELGCGRYTRRGMLESQMPKMLRWRLP